MRQPGIRVWPSAALSAAITYSQNALAVVGDVSTWPAADFHIQIDDELILVGTRTGQNLTGLTRGVEGTDDTHHPAGADVYYVKTGADILSTRASGLPTADPHIVGRLWNNAGVLTISAGP